MYRASGFVVRERLESHYHIDGSGHDALSLSLTLPGKGRPLRFSAEAETQKWGCAVL